MTRRRKIAAFLFCGMLLLAVLWLTFAHRHPAVADPIYSGRHLSSWLADFARPNPNAWGPATDAVRAIGTNAGPLLLSEAATPDSAVRYGLMYFLQRVVKLRIGNNWTHQAKALQGFYALGTNGAVLLAQGLTNSHPSIRLGCVGQWEMAKRYPEILFEPLFARLQDPEPKVRARAANALGMLGQQPARVIPPLTDLLHDQNDWVRCMAALGLSMFGPRARPALPVLFSSLSNCSSTFAYFATNAVKAIGPVVANGSSL